MKVAVLCEFSGVVRDAFIRQGHHAISFDILESESSFGPHIQGDILSIPFDYWQQFDLIIAHPPCTYLAVSGARWFNKPGRLQKQNAAINFVKYISLLPVKKIVIENPISVLSSKWRKPDQIIQPYMFGHGEVKATCLWLKGVSKLVPTDVVKGRLPRVHYCSPGKDRWKERSRTLIGIANAMASQWGKTEPSKVVEL